ncbi:MAG TPA: low affinity iron permease family protein [Candidatus Saccharimonadales bacterium]|nr:low affinity iron permease family protein [Candidatus Saccharimonadales bacterium]
MKLFLQRLSIAVSRLGSSTSAFLLSIAVVLVWLISGPYFHFSEKWLITITVVTDVIIFVMVFSIQNTQFRDSKAIQLKLNELIVADQKARDTFIGLETLTDSELSMLDEEFKQLLARMDDHSAMHKLHATIKREKARRPTFYEQAGHFMDKLFEPLGGEHPDTHKKR